MSRTQTRIISIAFIFFFGAPLVAHIAGVRPGPVENRRDAEPPPVALAFGLDEDYFDALADHLNDNFPLRDPALAANLALDDAVFQSSSVTVARGSDGWLFYRPSLDGPCRQAPLARSLFDDPVLELDAIAATVPTVVVVPPDKHLIHPEYLGESALTAACAARASEELRAAFEAADRDWFRPLWDELESGADEGPLYMATDTHWNDAGAMIALEAIFGDLFDPDEIVDLGLIDWQGDLSRLSGVPQVEPIRRLVIQRPGVEVGLIASPPGQHPLVRVFEASPGPDSPELLTGTTIVVHDSFLEPGLTDHLLISTAQYSERTMFVHWSAVGQLDLEEMTESADRVVFETVQRSFAERAQRLVDARQPKS